MLLEGKTAVITGASGGIGQAMVRQFAQAGSGKKPDNKGKGKENKPKGFFNKIKDSISDNK